MSRLVALLVRLVAGLSRDSIPREDRRELGRLVAELCVEARRREGVLSAAGHLARELADLVALAASNRRSRGAARTARAPGEPRRPLTTRMTDMYVTTGQDLRHAWRLFRREPLFAATAVLIVGVAVGATAATVSVVNAYLVRSLPFPDADRLVQVETTADRRVTPPEGLYGLRWADRLDEVFDGVIAWDLDAFTLLGAGAPETVEGAWVTPGYFALTGVRPVLGRAFTAAEAERDGPRVVLISYGLWQRRFGGDVDVVGRNVRAYSSDRPDEVEVFTIIGVLPRDFWFLNRFTDALAPLRGPRFPSYGRLKPGVTAAAAAGTIEAIARAELDGAAPEWHVRLRPAHEAYVEAVRPLLLALVAAVGLVLLIACGNVALLLLVRTVGRTRELALRRALGAGRWRIGRQLVTEGLVLALAAAGVGLLIAWNALPLVRASVQDQLARAVPGGLGAVALDGRVLLATLAAALASGLLFGAIPILAVRRGEPTAALRDGSRTGTEGRVRHGLRGTLVAVELALSLALAIGAGLTLRSAMWLSRQELGLRSDNVLMGSIMLPKRTYAGAAARRLFADRLLGAAAAVPGVTRAALATAVGFGATSGLPLEAEGAVDAGGGPVEAYPHAVTPEYFETLGIPLVEGRRFTDADGAGAAPVAVISESLARQLWPDESPIGHHVRPGRLAMMMDARGDPPWRTVVGVVGDVRKSLTGAQVPDVYTPFAQDTTFYLTLVARIDGAPGPITRGLQRALTSLDPELPLSETGLVEDLVARSISRPRFLASLLAGFAGFAVLLALSGVYGVISFAVSHRRRDVAIRTVLGARPDEIVRLFVRREGRLLAAGLAAGLGASLVFSRALTAELYGVRPIDAATYVTLTSLLAAAAVLAVLVPARRAASADPMEALKNE